MIYYAWFCVHMCILENDTWYTVTHLKLSDAQYSCIERRTAEGKEEEEAGFYCIAVLVLFTEIPSVL